MGRKEYIEMLVSKKHPLDANFVPDNLVPINEPMGSKSDPDYRNMLDKEAYDMFKEMQIAALKEGYEIFVDSSYRSIEYQNELYQNAINDRQKGEEWAKKYIAFPGKSEHHTGLAFDVISRRNGVMKEQSSEDDLEIKWLHNNSWKYGYILRYPKYKEKETGYEYERWHLRYVGLDLAKKLWDKSHLEIDPETGEIADVMYTLDEYYRDNQESLRR